MSVLSQRHAAYGSPLFGSRGERDSNAPKKVPSTRAAKVPGDGLLESASAKVFETMRIG